MAPDNDDLPGYDADDFDDDGGLWGRADKNGKIVYF